MKRIKLTDELGCLLGSMHASINLIIGKPENIIKIIVYQKKVNKYLGKTYNQANLSNLIVNHISELIKTNEGFYMNFEKNPSINRRDFLYTIVFTEGEGDVSFSCAFKDGNYIFLRHKTDEDIAKWE
jgi:hypothetical protein